MAMNFTTSHPQTKCQLLPMPLKHIDLTRQSADSFGIGCFIEACFTLFASHEIFCGSANSFSLIFGQTPYFRPAAPPVIKGHWAAIVGRKYLYVLVYSISEQSGYEI